MTKLLLSALLMGISFSALAQNKTFPGYLVTLEGDTLQGQVKDRSDARNSLSVSFKSNADGDFTEYTPSEVKGYGISGKKSFAAEQITTIKYLQDPRDTITHFVFLQQLVDGPVALYFLKTAGEPDRFFLKRGADNFSELEQRAQIVKVNGRTYRQTLNLYHDTLQAVFRQCPELAAKAKRVDFSISGLTKAFVSYNACTQPSQAVAVSETAQRSLVLVPSITVGFATGTVRTNDERTLLPDPKGRQGVSGGIALNIFPMAFRKSMSLQIGLDYTRKGADGSRHLQYSYSTVPIDSKVDMQTLNLTALVKLNKTTGFFRPFIGAGPTAGYVLNYEEAYRYGNSRDVFPPVKAEYGIAAETGFQVPIAKNHGLALSMKYEGTRIGFNFSNRGEYYNNYFRLGVGYWFSSAK